MKRPEDPGIGRAAPRPPAIEAPGGVGSDLSAAAAVASSWPPRGQAATPMAERSVSLPVRIGFGFTAVVDTTTFQIFEIFLIFYYAQVLGLAGGLAGLAVALVMLADAFIDPVIGSYSDSFRGRFGRRHTLMYLALVPTAIFVWLLFSAPAGLGQAGLFAWLFGLSLALRVVGSFYAVPASAIGAELTEQAPQRAELGIWRQVVTVSVNLLLTWAIFRYAFVPSEAFPRGQENPDNYFRFALLVAGAILLGALIGALATQRPVQEFERRHGSAVPEAFSIAGALRATWRALVDLPNFRALFLGLLFAGVMGSYFRALNLHLGTYFWQLSTAQTGNWLISVQAAMFASAVSTRFVVGRVEPKTLYVTGVAMMLGGFIVPVGLRLVGLMPPNGTELLVNLLYAANLVVGAGMGLIMACSLVMFAETADEYAFVKGESRTGLLLAFLPLGNKLASSFGKLGAGLVVQFVALPVGQSDVVAEPRSLTFLGLATVSVTAVAGFTALAAYARYHLPRSRHAEIVRGLEAARARS